MLWDELLIRTSRIDVLEFINGKMSTWPGQLLRDVETTLNMTYGDVFAEKTTEEKADGV